MSRSTAPRPLSFFLVLAASLGACDRPTGGAADEAEVTSVVIPARSLASLPAGVTPAMVAEGERLFATACIACHGADAGGSQLAPSLRDGEWIHVDGSYGEIVSLIRAGVPDPEEHPVPMPPRGGGDFDDAQLRALAAYVATLGEPAPAAE